MNNGERRLCEWQQGHSSNFVTKLFELLAACDDTHREEMLHSFPEETMAFIRYQEEKGYWNVLEQEWANLNGQDIRAY